MINILLGVLLSLAAILALWRVIRRFRRGSACCGEREKTVRRTGPARGRLGGAPYAAEIEIQGMTCENCARKIENALNELDGQGHPAVLKAGHGGAGPGKNPGSGLYYREIYRKIRGFSKFLKFS